MDLTDREKQLIHLSLDWFAFELLYKQMTQKGNPDKWPMINEIDELKDKFMEGNHAKSTSDNR